jgi:hypothetical protein
VTTTLSGPRRQSDPRPVGPRVGARQNGQCLNLTGAEPVEGLPRRRHIALGVYIARSGASQKRWTSASRGRRTVLPFARSRGSRRSRAGEYDASTATPGADHFEVPSGRIGVSCGSVDVQRVEE